MDTLRPKLTLLEPQPTPLQYLPGLSQELFREMYIKRDDLTPWGGGGNKLRKLEYLMFEALNPDRDRCFYTYRDMWMTKRNPMFWNLT